MANRRMFSLDVVDTDKFLEMPVTSQALYFHMGMRADDDGFLANPKKIMRLANCTADDLKVLLSKGYILPLDDGILVIRHWKQNNYIQSDRYKKTIYTEQMAMLTENNGVYEMYTDSQHSVSTGKDSIEKNNISCSPDDEREPEKAKKPAAKTSAEQDMQDFEKIYAIYPKKCGRARAFQYYRGYVNKGREIDGIRWKLDRRQIYLAALAYVKERQQEGTELRYYKNFDVFLSKTVLDYLPKEAEE